MPDPMTITAAADLIRRGELTPVELLDQCLARIDRYEERVRAWAYLDRDGAREQAERLTAELKQNHYRGPLHGIPVGVKDIIDVFDLPTGCGSKRWANSYARRDATCVERLRQAGAVILGKTVTTAYASFDPPPTRNPWNLERTAGGSSSGSAAAVACGMCLGALGTQTGGSITRPASYCGVYSLKPTYGRVSVDGVLPLAPSLDHVGVMANCVRDLAILIQPIVNGQQLEQLLHCSADIAFWAHNGLSHLPDFAPGLIEPEMEAAFDEFRARTARAEGATPVAWQTVALPSTFADARPNQLTVMAVEAAAYHADRFRRHPDDYPPNISALIRRGLEFPADRYVHVLGHKHRFETDLYEAQVPGFKAFATPAAPGPAPDALTTGDPVCNTPWSYAGLPTVSLPVGWSADRLPLAVQLVGARFEEEALLKQAYLVERLIGFERRPVPL